MSIEEAIWDLTHGKPAFVLRQDKWDELVAIVRDFPEAAARVIAITDFDLVPITVSWDEG